MDKKVLAKELVKIAKELTGSMEFNSIEEFEKYLNKRYPTERVYIIDGIEYEYGASSDEGLLDYFQGKRKGHIKYTNFDGESKKNGKFETFILIYTPQKNGLMFNGISLNAAIY